MATLWLSAASLFAGPPGEGWELVFHDEFNGKQLDWKVWTCEQGDRRDAYNDPEDSYLDGKGHLLLRIRKAPDGKFHLGFIRTQKDYPWGYYEARTQLDTVPGYWSAFWLWGKESYNPNFDGAEVDIQEDPHRDDVIEHNIHQGEGPTHKHEGAKVKFSGLRTDWHLFACDRHEQGFDFFVDGEASWMTRTMKASKPNWIYLTLESKFEGWAEDIRQFESKLPAYYVVDYVRYYRKNAKAPFIAVGASDKVLRVALNNGTFAKRLDPAKWSIENLPEGVTLGGVKRVDDRRAELKLKGGAAKAGWTVIAEAGEVADSPSLLIANVGAR